MPLQLNHLVIYLSLFPLWLKPHSAYIHFVCPIKHTEPQAHKARKIVNQMQEEKKNKKEEETDEGIVAAIDGDREANTLPSRKFSSLLRQDESRNGRCANGMAAFAAVAAASADTLVTAAVVVVIAAVADALLCFLITRTTSSHTPSTAQHKEFELL